MKPIQSALAVFAALAIGGCAHPVVINPDFSKLEPAANSIHSQKNAAYYIPENLRTQTVTTPGGGGDKISYTPYKDIEAGFYKMLSNVYRTVTKLSSPNDAEAIQKNAVDLVIVPEITTTSSSPSAFTWPPTKFTVELTSRVSDPAGKVLASPKVIGQGQAEYDEFKADFSLSGKRASQDALMQMQAKLLEMNAAAAGAGTGTQQTGLIDDLKSLRDRGVITDADFEMKRKEISERK